MATEGTQMTKDEIMKQLPDDFEKLSILGKLTGPPTTEDYTPLTSTGKKESLVRSFLNMFNPFVPIGLACTVFFLANGLRHMVRGNKKQSQMMMRGRVSAQGFTLIALVGGIYWEMYKKQEKDYNE